MILINSNHWYQMAGFPWNVIFKKLEIAYFYLGFLEEYFVMFCWNIIFIPIKQNIEKRFLKVLFKRSIKEKLDQAFECQNISGWTSQEELKAALNLSQKTRWVDMLEGWESVSLRSRKIKPVWWKGHFKTS